MTNTYEGVGFVDSPWPSTVQEYISNLFPLLPEKHAADGAKLYQGLGTAAEQIGLIMGDCERLFNFLRLPVGPNF